MDNPDDNISEKLVLFLDKELAEPDIVEVGKRLATDSGVQAEYQSLLQTRAAILHYGLKCQVAEEHKKMMEQIQQPVKQLAKTRRIIRYSMAAAAGLLLLISAYVAYNYFSLSSDKIFYSNYHTYQLSVTRDVSNIFTPVERAYDEKNYKEVLRIHDAKEDKTAKAEFLTGVASLELRNNSKAIKCFNEVIEMNTGATTPLLQDESEYYLALAYIKNKDYDYAIAMLNKISDNEEHKYRQKISPKLIRQVQKLKQR
jgi:tetratricopeptide (TPR) repeat protein